MSKRRHRVWPDMVYLFNYGVAVGYRWLTDAAKRLVDDGADWWALAGDGGQHKGR